MFSQWVLPSRRPLPPTADRDGDHKLARLRRRRVLSKLFRRLTKLAAAHAAGKLQFFGTLAHLTAVKAFPAFLASLRKTRWFVYAKRPFAGPKAVLAYLSRYTH